MTSTPNTNDWEMWEETFAANIELFKQLGRPPFDKTAKEQEFVPFLEFLFEMEAKHRMESERFCRRLASGEPPLESLSAWAGYITYLRWLNAMDFLAHTQTNGASGVTGMRPPDGASAEQIQLFLFVDLWSYSYDQRLKTTGLSWYYDLPLFGLVPYDDNVERGI